MSQISIPAAEPAPSRVPPAPRRLPALNYEAIGVFASLALAWHLASGVLPAFLFPSFGAIGSALYEVLSSASALGAIGLTFVRILSALAVSFVLALLLGILAGFQPRVDRGLLPLVQFLQGVPAVCWVIFAVLWFKDTEIRIAFVVLISSLPSFFYQIREGVRSISPELAAMVRALRPSPAQYIRKLVLPSLVPQILTGWRLNLGGGTKVTIMAELLGGISGIGYQLRVAQELFRMDQAIAWTIVLVSFVLLTNAVVTRIDRRLLGWRTP